MNPDRFRSNQDRVNFTILANARRICAGNYKRLPNWVLVSELFGLGSTSATLICHQCGIDPDSNVVVTVPRAA